jgi:phospholipid N-methyltransferase
VSSAIAARLPQGAGHVAVEGDPALVAFLQCNQAGVEVLNADARDLSELLVGQEISRVTARVIGLPWSLFDSDSREHILQQVI